ncbi:hypothetical protein INT45_003424 [Circinella minor]|uniref:Uncharacterized protein n=1 Tax=Circinella minor TaxID=1195481 RepID=A0A8H7VP27_9FUNG|nr:hypothetical protein INT45_003424 [Circinella minor]
MMDDNKNDNSMTIEIIDNPFFKQQVESIKKEKTFATGVTTTRDEISKKSLIDDIYDQINQSVWDSSPVLQFYKHLSTISNLKMNPSRRRGKENKAEMPTIHIIADPTEIALLNENKLKKKKVDAKMLYISSSVIQEFNQVDFKIAERTTRTLQKLTYAIKIRNNEPSSTCSLHGFHRIKLCSFGYDLSRSSHKLKYRMVASLKMPTSSFNYVKVYINNHPIGIFELFGSQDAPYIDNKLSYDEKRQLHQQKNSVYKYHQIEPSVTPILKKDDDVCILNARYNNTIGKRENHNFQQNSYKIMNESIWRKSDMKLNQHSVSDGLTTGRRYQLPEQNYLDMNNVLFKNIATNGVSTMDKVVDDHLLKENKPSSTMSSKAENDLNSVNRGISLMRLLNESTNYILLPDINECIE